MAIALIGVLLIGSSAGTIALLRTYLQQNTDTLLTSTASSLRDENPGTLEIRLAAGLVTLPSLPSDYYIAFVTDSGELALGLVASTGDAKVIPNVTGLDKNFVDNSKGIPFEVEVITPQRQDRTFRLVTEPLTRFDGAVIVALPVDNNRQLINEYSLIGGRIGVVILILAGFSIWLTISSALKPLREVERTAAAIQKGDFSQRLVPKPENTEIGKLNRSLNSMLDGIEDSFIARGKTLQQMRQFVSDASHELRTPLASIRGYSELYQMGAMKKKADVQQAMERIESEAKRMGGLVENLLTLTRLDELSALVRKPSNLVKLAQASVQDSVAAFPENSFELLFPTETVPAKELIASIDESQIRQVLTNLLANAARFSPQESPIELQLEQTEMSIKFRVVDHGEGIPEPLREKVFQRFYRVDNSRNSETGGSGLGLAIATSIVSAHQGRIWIETTPGGGATFVVELPKASDS